MTCRCLNICWVPEIFDSRYPIPKHHPVCDEYKTELFAKIEFEGTSCVMEINEAKQVIDDSEENYKYSEIQLTRDQFDNMKEFAGF